MSEVFLLVPNLSFSPRCSPKHETHVSGVSEVWKGRARRGLLTAAHLGTPRSRTGQAAAEQAGQPWVPVMGLGSFWWLLSSCSQVIQQNQHNVLAGRCWRRHSSKLGCPLGLLVVFKVRGLPPVTYPNSVSPGSKMRQISIASVAWGDWVSSVNNDRWEEEKKTSPQPAFPSKSCGLLKL